MEKPEMEATIYCQAELMSAMMKGIESQHLNTIFNNEDITELLKALRIGLAALQIEFDRSYDAFNEKKSVCF